MKRLFALVLVMILALTALVSCEMPESVNGILGTVKDKVNTLLGKEPEGNSQLDAADAFLFDLYKNAATETPSSYNLVSVVTIEGVKFTVTWESNNEAVTIVAAEDPNFVTVVVPKSNEPIRYTLTATITDADGNVKTRTFERSVPAFKVFTFAEYAAAADDATVVVRGIVTGIFSKTNGSSGNGVYIQDLKGEGGYYVYGLVDSKDPEADLGLKVGMTVTVSGIKDTYNGLYEVVTANIEIDDATIKTVEPVDFTEIYKNAAALTDAALVTRQSMLVTVKGVEIGGVKEDNGYYYFKLGALESYIRISSSNNCISKADIATFKANHTSHKGYKADVTGIIQLYNGAFYLIPVSVDVESNYAEIERTDAEKVTFELDGVTLPEIITEDGVITVPAVGAKYNNVVLTYVSDNACITYENGKLTVTLPEANTKVTVTVTATLGEGETAITETATFVISVKAATKGVYIGKPEANPVAGKAYKFYLTAKDGLNYYFTGLISDKYLQTSTNVADGVDVYLAEVKDAEGKVTGYNFYFMDGETKTYITITDGKAALTTENPVAFNYVAETNSWTDGTNYLGTYSKYTTIGASANSYINAENTGTSQFPAGFATVVVAEEKEITDAEKAETEKKKLTIQNKFVEDGSLELPAVGETYEDVVITWTVNGAAVEGKYDIVLGAEEQTLTVLATIKSGEVTESKEFTVTVAAKPSFEITYPTTIVPGTAYHIYTPEGPVFFGGALSDKNGLATVDTLEEATAIYFEAAAKEGTFYMYFYDANGAKKYIDMTANSTTKFALVDTAPEKGIWAIDEFGIYNAYWYTDNSAKPDGVSYYRYLAFYANNGDVRTYAPSTTGNPWMKLAEVSEGHTHTDANTDGVCDGCQQEVDETGDTPLTGTDAN